MGELGRRFTGYSVNAYYQENSDMMLGKMEYGTRYGENSTTDLVAFDDFDLKRIYTLHCQSLTLKLRNMQAMTKKKKPKQSLPIRL